MSQRIYRLQVTKDQLGFAAAHFITMRGKCERLHGHNYRVTVEVEGFLCEDQYVVDFGVLKNTPPKLPARLIIGSCWPPRILKSSIAKTSSI